MASDIQNSTAEVALRTPKTRMVSEGEFVTDDEWDLMCEFKMEADMQRYLIPGILQVVLLPRAEYDAAMLEGAKKWDKRGRPKELRGDAEV